LETLFYYKEYFVCLTGSSEQSFVEIVSYRFAIKIILESIPNSATNIEKEGNKNNLDSEACGQIVHTRIREVKGQNIVPETIKSL
jgi:hypothetical protein